MMVYKGVVGKSSIFLISLIALIIFSIYFGLANASIGNVGVCYNTPPTINNLSDQVTSANTLFTYQINGSDVNGDNLRFLDNTSLFVIGNESGLINFTPIGQGTYTIEINLTDSNASCPWTIQQTFILQVNNQPPVLNFTIPNQTWEEDISLTGLNLSQYFSDPDGDVLSFSATNGSNIRILISNNSIVTFTPAKDFYGLSWVIFHANDGFTTTNSNNVTLNVTQIANYCGDNICNSGESCSSCTADCGVCPVSSPSPGSSGGSSSSGSGGGSVVTKPSSGISSNTNSWKVNKGIEAFLEPNWDILQSVKFKFNQEVESRIISLSVYKEKPPAILQELNGIIYSYLDISSDIVEVENIEIRFRVSKEWLFQNSLIESEVVLMHLKDTWIERPTNIQSEDATHFYFISTAPSHSYFAITSRSNVVSCKITQACTIWEPISCDVDKEQQRSCAGVDKNCETNSFTEVRLCLCQPEWVCTDWLPTECEFGQQQRSCQDNNACGKSFGRELVRDCPSAASSGSLVKNAFASNSFIIAILIIIIILVLLRLWYQNNKLS